jgi:hypothetical protein
MSNHTGNSYDHARLTNGRLSIPVSEPERARLASDADIAKRAYEKFEARGRVHGFDLEDWSAASHELNANLSAAHGHRRVEGRVQR